MPTSPDPERRLVRRALGRNPFESARRTLPMYKHAEHRPHRAANKHQQRENHPPHHLRRQEQPPKKEDRERHEPPRLPFVEATSSLNLESWSFSSLAVWFRTLPPRSSNGPRCHHHSGCWPRRPLCVLSGRPSFCSETSSNGLVEFASIPTRRNPDVKRDDTHPPPKGRRCRDQTTCQGRVPLRRPGDERRDCPSDSNCSPHGLDNHASRSCFIARAGWTTRSISTAD